MKHTVKVKFNLNTLPERSRKNHEYLKHSLKKYGEKDKGSDLTATQVQHYQTMNQVTVTRMNTAKHSLGHNMQLNSEAMDEYTSYYVYDN